MLNRHSGVVITRWALRKPIEAVLCVVDSLLRFYGFVVRINERPISNLDLEHRIRVPCWLGEVVLVDGQFIPLVLARNLQYRQLVFEAIQYRRVGAIGNHEYASLSTVDPSSSVTMTVSPPLFQIGLPDSQ